ncbi:uncharacterized protein DUF983 [Nonlabens dokdonensis]|uniref:DUF983 domain-containing protein n=2 Tax=Nonlabens dokdonensis TaxID=328515 RepID=L7W7Z0_NONDD|nr:DUF983 domain-containing protein [Nonlabens dokdonensis]AGC75906.1 hypothetical protein DDD_0779 [Nonlabens dokdonensis DSW-6]PZX43586.1 uncharacterized protein DUF983 [Nonlabens dokdonensis]
MMLQKTMLYSILFLKCPQCRQGEFLEAHPYKFSKMNSVRERCPKCNLKYSIEPSFYTGSMYVSYGVGIAFAVAAYMILLILGFADSPLRIFIIIVITLAVFFPYIGAISKAIWAHFFFKYDPVKAQEVKNDSRTSQ